MSIWSSIGRFFSSLGGHASRVPPVPPPPLPREQVAVMVRRNQVPVLGATGALRMTTGDLPSIGCDASGRVVFVLPPDVQIGWTRGLTIIEADGTTTDCGDQVLAENMDVDLPSKLPAWTPAPRTYAGDICGTSLPGIPLVDGAPSRVPSLVLSWFYPFYDEGWRQRIRDQHRGKGFTDFAVSWPDARARGVSPALFAAYCRELRLAGFCVTVMGTSKDFDGGCDLNELVRRVEEIRPYIDGTLLAQTNGATGDKIHRFCAFWEGSLWLDPALAMRFVEICAVWVLPAGLRHYVHFGQGTPHWSIDGPVDPTVPGVGSFHAYWMWAQGKLHGILWQARTDGEWSWEECKARFADITDRFTGRVREGTPQDNGITGESFSAVGWELTAQRVYDGSMSFAEHDRLAADFVATTAGDGSGNG